MLKFKRQKSDEPQKEGVPQAMSLNPIYRQLRMLERRVADLEETTRTQRLTLSRIERAFDRARARQPQTPAEKPGNGEYSKAVLHELGLDLGG